MKKLFGSVAIFLLMAVPSLIILGSLKAFLLWLM
jgi:hypothetical protein